MSTSPLITFPEEAAELFHSPDGRAFVDVIDTHRETWLVRGQEFRRWYERHHYRSFGRMPTSTELSSAIRLLEGCAHHDGPERDVYNRVTRYDGHIYLDLADEHRHVVDIGPDGWRLIDRAPIHFVRLTGMRPLPIPQPGGSIEALRSFLNVDDTAFVLVFAWILDALRGGDEHPVLVLEGAEGTAKSALLAILQALIDPTIRPAAGLPRSERTLLSEAENRYLLPFDNIPAISPAMSDALCRLATGGGHPVIMAGIEHMVLRRDLADRCLFVTCEAQDHCQPRSTLMSDVEKSLPMMLGALLDLACHGLRQLPDMQPDNLTRMADFELWSMAWESALWPTGTFSAAYRANRAAAAEDQLDADPVASAVRALIASKSVWTGNATKLHVTLTPIFEMMGKNGVPVSPRDLAVKLRKAQPSLAKVGIRTTFGRHGHDRDRIMTIFVAADANGTRTDAASGGIASRVQPPMSASSASSANADVEAPESIQREKTPRFVPTADDADDADARKR